MEASAGGWARRALPGFFSPLEVVANVPTTMARAARLAAAGEPEGPRWWPRSRPRAGAASAASGWPRRAARCWSRWCCGPRSPGVGLADGGRRRGRPGRGGRRGRPGAGPAGLKWPNDLELGGRKAAGLLAEAHLEGDRLAAVLLGMGVNVAQGGGDFPPEVAGRATSVSLAAGAPVDRATCWPPGLGGSWAATPSCAPAGRVRCWPPTGSAWSPSAARSGPTASAPPGGGHRRRPDPGRRPGRADRHRARVEVTAGDVHHLRGI